MQAFFIKLLILFVLIILGYYVVIFTWKYIIKFFFDINLSKEEEDKIKKEYDKLYKNSAINDANADEKYLLEVKLFYENLKEGLSSDFKDYFDKLRTLFNLFSFSIPIYAAALGAILKHKNFKLNECTCLPYLILAFIIYIYFFCRIVYMQGFSRGYKTLGTQLPYLKSSKNTIDFLKNYIHNNSKVIQLNKTRLLKMQTKLKHIHYQYIIASIFLITMLTLAYVQCINIK